MKLSDLKKKYPGQCLILRPTKLNQNNEVLEGELLAVGKTAEEALAKLPKKPTNTALYYTAEVPPMHTGGQPFKKPKDLDDSL